MQGCIDAALSKLVTHKVESYISSRTDKGVHALRNTLHCDLRRVHKKTGEPVAPFTAEVVHRAVNFHLKDNPVSVKEVRAVSQDFHSRFSAKSRTYRQPSSCRSNRHAVRSISSQPLVGRYRIHCGLEVGSCFERESAWHVKPDLDATRMQEAANHMLGTHDFTSFRAARCEQKSPVRTIDSLDVWEETPHSYMGIEGPGKVIHVKVKARSFLYHMVRNIVGCLKMVGEGQMETDEIPKLLHLKNRDKAPAMAPAAGLMLADVGYGDMREFEVAIT